MQRRVAVDVVVARCRVVPSSVRLRVRLQLALRVAASLPRVMQASRSRRACAVYDAIKLRMEQRLCAVHLNLRRTAEPRARELRNIARK